MSGKKDIFVFEDSKYKNFLPIAYTIPVFMLKHGFMSNLERIIIFFKEDNIFLLTRNYLANITHNQTGKSVNDINIDDNQEVTFVNGRVTNLEKLTTEIKSDNYEGEKAVFNGDNLIYLRIKKKRLNILNGEMNEFFLKEDLIETVKSLEIEKKEIEIECINYPWDLIYNNFFRIISDYEGLIKHGSIKGKVDSGAYLYKEKNIYVGRNSTVMSGVVIIAEDGPVAIDDEVRVMPNSVIYGPCYIGKKSLIKAGATVYGGTTIGEVCKAGGEIENSIMHSYSNKQHYGFLGHSYIGKWCNLGAGTSTSDLKNNYGNIRIRVGNEEIDTERIFMGMLMGDHSKTAINTSINTGTVIGVMCNIFARDFPDKYIPSFSWVGNKIEKYDFDKAIQTAKRVMARRNKELNDEDISVLRYVYEEADKEIHY